MTTKKRKFPSLKDAALKIAMEVIPMIGDPEIYRQRVDDFAEGYLRCRVDALRRGVRLWPARKPKVMFGGDGAGTESREKVG